MYKPGQVNRGGGNVGGAQALIVKGKEAKKIRSPLPVPGRGQASSSPMSEDGNDKELLSSICQLHRQIRADHTPAKDIVSAIGKLKMEIQNLISELDDSEENTEEQKNPAKSKPVVPKATESGTNKSKDLYTVATTTKKKCRKLNSDLVKTRKELKEISELAVAVGQEVGFQPKTSRADKEKDSLNINANRALEDIKRMNKELSEELNKLSKNIERYSTDQPEQQRNDKNQQSNSTRQQLQTANQAKKTKDQSEEKKDHKSSKFDTNLEIISKAVRSFDDLQLYKRELKKISELAVTVGQEVGFQPDTSNADKDKEGHSSNATKEHKYIKQRNTELKKISELAVTVGQEVGFQPDTSKTDKDKEGHSCNATKALKYIKQRNTKLNQQLDILRKKITTNPTCLNAQQQPEEKQQKEKKIPKSTQKGTDKPNPVKDQRQNKEDRNENREGKKENREAQNEASGQISPVQFDTNLQIVSETVEYVGNLQNNKIQMDSIVQSTIRLCMWKEDNPIKDESVFVQLERAVRDIDVDLDNYRHLASEYRKLNQELDILREKIKTNPACLSAQQQPEEKQHNERKQQKSTQKMTDKPNPVKDQSENKEDRNESREGKKENREAQNEASGQISPFQFDTNLQIVSETVEYVGNLQNNKITYEQMQKHVWMTTNAAAVYVNELTSYKGPDKFQIVKVKEVQSDKIDQFNQLVVDMIKTIEGFVDTRSGDEIQKLKREIERKVKENEVLHNRLSKLAGNKMTEGNPNIANLGDPNRPTKIAEVYSEIYDNEWTDTLDCCLKKLGKEYSEDDALQALNKTLIICYKICQEKSDEWIQKTKEVLNKWLADLMVDIQSDEILMQIMQGRKVDPDKRSQQLLKEIRPKKDLVATKYAKEMNSSKLYKMIIQNKFFEKCFTLCWKMIVQNPRMILVEGPSKGEKYDRNIFREFTSSGSKVVFTVWPALYLHKDGPLLVKGVVKVE